MSIYLVSGNSDGEIVVEALGNNNVLGPFPQTLLLSTDIRMYEHGEARIRFIGIEPNEATLAATYDGDNFRLRLEKCDGFYLAMQAGTAIDREVDAARIDGDVRKLIVSEYVRGTFFRNIY